MVSDRSAFRLREAAQRALKKAFKGGRADPRRRQYSDDSQFRDILGVETLLLGLALSDCRAHSPNENFPLENLDSGIRINKAILQENSAEFEHQVESCESLPKDGFVSCVPVVCGGTLSRAEEIR